MIKITEERSVRTMANSALKDVNQMTNKNSSQISQKPLKVLRESTNKQIVAERNLKKQDKEVLKDQKKLSEAAKNVEVAGKENTPILRRSKRKIPVASEAKLNADTLIMCKTRKSAKNVRNLNTKSKTAPKPSRECSTIVMEEIPAKNQSNSNLSPVIASQAVPGSSKLSNSNVNLQMTLPARMNEDSGFESSATFSDQSLVNSRLVLHSPVTNYSTPVDNETCILTCDITPISYWKELAEQRRKTLETALYENESLHDQLAVLEAENSQLKQLVEQAKGLAEVVKDMILQNSEQ